MKVFFFLIGIAAAGVLGYSYEPSMRYSLTGKEPTTGEAADPKPPGEGAPHIDPATFPQERLPEQVTLKTDVEFASGNSGLTVNAPAGSKVNLVRIDGSKVVVSPGVGGMEGSVPFAATDLIELLAGLAEEPELKDQQVEMAPKADPTPQPEAEIAEKEGEETMPEVAAKPEAMPEAESTSPPEPEAAAGPVDAVAIMKASIQAGEIKEFNFDQVMEWEAVEEEEDFNGESYKVGLLSYKAETFVGVRMIQAKALIKGGKVAHWLWPKSGMEIK